MNATSQALCDPHRPSENTAADWEELLRISSAAAMQNELGIELCRDAASSPNSSSVRDVASSVSSHTECLADRTVHAPVKRRTRSPLPSPWWYCIGCFHRCSVVCLDCNYRFCEHCFRPESRECQVCYDREASRTFLL